jgi:signal transduction histidine kinase
MVFTTIIPTPFKDTAMDSDNNFINGKIKYYGNILKDEFSDTIKDRLRKVLPVFHAFDRVESPVIHYISAWQGNEKNIWYEFVSRQFLGLMGCDTPAEAADIFRKTIIDRRIYKYQGIDDFIEKEVTSRTEIEDAREKLRAESEKTGFIEAVYKLAIPSESAIWIKDQASIESYPQDRTALSFGCLTIVTKEMATEEERQRLLDEKLKLESQLQRIHHLDAIGNLASGIAEDLNQRVTGIHKRIADLASGLSQGTFDDISPFQHYQNLKAIEEHLKEVNDLSKQLLTFSGKVPYDFMEVDLTETIQTTLDDFDFGKKQIHAEIELCPGLLMVKADRAHISRALFNLFRTAAQAMPPGGKLFLQTDNTVLETDAVKAWEIEPGDYISIVISLHDIRLSEKDKQRIIEPFYRDGGDVHSGLNLATAYGIIKKHGGMMSVADNPEGGTSFRIYLPAI